MPNIDTPGRKYLSKVALGKNLADQSGKSHIYNAHKRDIDLGWYNCDWEIGIGSTPIRRQQMALCQRLFV